MSPPHSTPHARAALPHPSWGSTLLTSSMLIACMGAISATFWLTHGVADLQVRKATQALAHVDSRQGFFDAFEDAVHCRDPEACVLGSTLPVRIEAFWSAARASGAIRFAPEKSSTP
jgi:hypothetical protein